MVLDAFIRKQMWMIWHLKTGQETAVAQKLRSILLTLTVNVELYSVDRKRMGSSNTGTNINTTYKVREKFE